MNNCFIILAGGESKRFNSKIPKSFHIYKGKPLLLHSIDKAKNYKKFHKIVLVINKKHKSLIKKLKIKDIKIIVGGNTRAESSYKALKSIKNYNIKNVMIHDAARPNFSLQLLDKLNNALKQNDCVVPAVQSTDSIKQKSLNKIKNLKRENIYLIQTPQAFDYKTLYKLQNNKSIDITDDSSLFVGTDKKIKIIKGGIKIPFHLGTLGHSDGDPVLHAITDAILGACSMGDIGEKFSDKSKKFKNIRSTILLSKIIKQIKIKGYLINNIDINIIAQKPKIKIYKKKILMCIASLCEIFPTQINIKGKTTEKLGLIGKEKAIACEAIVSVIKYD